MSSITPMKKPASQPGQQGRARFARPNPVRAAREREERRQSLGAQTSFGATYGAQTSQAAYAANRNASLAVPSRSQCPNKACPKPNVVDGVCNTCGRVADDSNIVAEVQFGETSSGAAMVQGSFIGADQAGVRSMGPAFRRVGGSEDREKSIREAKGLMQGYSQQLNISENLVTGGTQVFKLASAANFIQGRTLPSVAAVCLYAACRIEPPCKVMLIDFADLVQINVFKLGRIFKKLNEAVPLGNDAISPVYPENLIWRFATKMEFHQDTARVAEDAVRLVKRMSRDWMVMGRRPAGICGACLLMAARMHNYRRTVREVVYIVKVTNHTIQNRLQEFNSTESSKMSVEDFLKQDFLESSHDPPSFYRRSEEYKKAAAEKSKKRKRVGNGEEDGSDAEEATQEEQRPRRDSLAQVTTVEADAELAKAPTVRYRRDAEGFIIPPLPGQPGPEPEVETLDKLVEEFGDALDEEDDGSAKAPTKEQLPINDEWVEDEADLEGQIDEIMNDPLTQQHADAYTSAEKRARIHSRFALQSRPQKQVSMAAEIEADEFADDPEVNNCLLSPEEARIKETIWVNQNRDWLRAHQEKVFRRKLEAERPKQTRRRRKRARMGEGQTSPASSAAEAAVNVAKDRGWSKRINYDAIRSIFDDIPNRGGLGSAATSRKTSPGLGSAQGEAAAANDDGDGEAADETIAEEPEYDETADFDRHGGGDGGEGEFEGGEYEEDNPDMDAEYGLEEEEGDEIDDDDLL